MKHQDILDARDMLARAYIAALEKYGDAARGAMPVFAASVVHREEHLIANDPSARAIALGQWTSAFHFALATIEADCDAQQATVAAMLEHAPAGQT